MKGFACQNISETFSIEEIRKFLLVEFRECYLMPLCITVICMVLVKVIKWEKEKYQLCTGQFASGSRTRSGMEHQCSSTCTRIWCNSHRKPGLLLYLSVWQVHIWQENFKLSVVLCFACTARNNPSLLSYCRFCTVLYEDLALNITNTRYFKYKVAMELTFCLLNS